jgi:hypothetical protein
MVLMCFVWRYSRQFVQQVQVFLYDAMFLRAPISVNVLGGVTPCCTVLAGPTDF